MTNFNNKIIDWYLQYHRKLPWRETSDPYKIWISEIILQQTQVKQGLNYYLRFIESFPDIKSLANASEQSVLKMWQGLGYYSRARNLHKAALYIVSTLSAEFPKSKADLQKISGIGPYTAAAIASIAYNEPHAVVDGNVYRLLSRVFAISTPIDSTLGKKEFETLANLLIDKDSPGIFNQAMMEMGALICTPSSPDCQLCPIASECKSRATGTQLQFPVKGKKAGKRTRFFNYINIRNKGFIVLSKREKGDIWQGLFEPLLIESDTLLSEVTLSSLLNKEWVGSNIEPKIKSEAKHILTHQIIIARFFEIYWPEQLKLPASYCRKSLQTIDLSDIHNYPIPRLIENYLSKHLDGY
jgi:A/G-specific adenine glycosylase